MQLKDSVEVPIVALHLPGDWRRRVKVSSPEGELAEPVVATKKVGGLYQVIVGLDQIARVAAQGADMVRVRRVKLSEEEAQAWRELEAASPPMLNKIIRSLEKPPPEEKPASPKRPRAVTQAQVAEQLGVPVDDLREAERRAREKAAAELVPIYDYRIKQPKEWLDYVNTVRLAIIDSIAAATAIARSLESLDKYEIGRMTYPKVQLKELAQTLLELRPHSVCHCCKNLPMYVQDCAACMREGWVGQGFNAAAVPPDLLGDEPLFVLHKGQMIEIDRESLGEDAEELSSESHGRAGNDAYPEIEDPDEFSGTSIDGQEDEQPQADDNLDVPEETLEQWQDLL